MKKFLFIFLVLIFSRTAICGYWTNLTGHTIFADTTITSGSKILINSSSFLSGPYTITIDSGAVVAFQGGDLFISATSTGKVIINGSVTKPVIFTSENDTPGGSPAMGDQFNFMLFAYGASSLYAKNFVCKYCTFNAGPIGFDLSSVDQPTKNVIIRNGLLQYCECTSSPNNTALIGGNNTYTNYLDSLIYDNIKIDNTCILSGATLPIALSATPALYTMISNNYIYPHCTFSANQPTAIMFTIETTTPHNQAYVVNNLVRSDSLLNAIFTVVTVAGESLTVKHNTFIMSNRPNQNTIFFHVAALDQGIVKNNLLINASGLGSVAFRVTAGTGYSEDFNNYYNNTSNSALALGAHDLFLDPSLTGLISGSVIYPGWSTPDGFVIGDSALLNHADSKYSQENIDTSLYSNNGTRHLQNDTTTMGIYYKLYHFETLAPQVYTINPFHVRRTKTFQMTGRDFRTGLYVKIGGTYDSIYASTDSTGKVFTTKNLKYGLDSMKIYNLKGQKDTNIFIKAQGTF